MNIRRIVGFAAVAGLLVIAAPAQRAEAMSLAGPASAATVKHASEALGMTENVHWRRHRGWHRHHGYRRHYGWRPRYHRRHYGYY